MKFNNRGFTLVEMLAVVVILGILATIMVPTVTSLINKNQEDNLKNLEKSILSVAKIYISDNRYNIILGGDDCSDSVRSVTKINGIDISNNKLPVEILIESGDLNDGNDSIQNPKDRGKYLDVDGSYIFVQYNCTTKDYDLSDEFNCSDNNSCLSWK